jgi:hypothetical protein
LAASRKVAETIRRELGCDIVTREEVLEHARQYGVEETGMADTDLMAKHPPHLWDRHSAQRRLYLIILRASLMDYVVSGNLIYLGHLGQFVLSDVPKLLRIRVDSTVDYRVRALMDGSKLTREDASDYIERIDERRRAWAKFLYGVDYDSPLHYDILLNLEKMSRDTAANVVGAAIKSPEWELDDAAKDQLRNLHLSSIILASLARSPRTRGMELAVDCDAKTGLATVRGMSTLIGSKTWEDDIGDVVAAVKGVNSVEVVDLR